MQAALLTTQAPIETNPLVLTDIPVPVPAAGEIRVRVLACGVCRTDLHVVEGDLPPRRLPLVPGHEIVGEIDLTGPGTRGFKPGDRIGIAWLRGTCGRCEYCLSGRENLCGFQQFTGYTMDGGYAEYAVVPAEWAYRIPERFDPVAAAPLLCAGIIGYRALLRSGIQHGQRLAVYGFGSSAAMAIQVARFWGCTVDVYSRADLHHQHARDLGAAWTGTPAETSPQPAHAAVIFAPAGHLVPLALKNTRRGGTVACAGIYMSDIPAMAYDDSVFYERNLVSVTANTRDDGLNFLDTAARIPIRSNTVTFPLAAANTALQHLKLSRLEGTAVLVPDRSLP